MMEHLPTDRSVPQPDDHVSNSRGDQNPFVQNLVPNSRGDCGVGRSAMFFASFKTPLGTKARSSRAGFRLRMTILCFKPHRGRYKAFLALVLIVMCQTPSETTTTSGTKRPTSDRPVSGVSNSIGDNNYKRSAQSGGLGPSPWCQTPSETTTTSGSSLV